MVKTFFIDAFLTHLDHCMDVACRTGGDSRTLGVGVFGSTRGTEGGWKSEGIKKRDRHVHEKTF